ncbi:hypothetical protein Misp03_37110 [Microbispora sp. NBRC 16548]|nr:hypothetical protein Misp03_37110 [Microbispora sp. NBRC 16548]
MKDADRKLPVAYSPGVMDDLRALSPVHRRLAILLIRDLAIGRERGGECGDRLGLDLRGCRKAYFGSADERRVRGAPWRIVYREDVRGDTTQSVIHIVAIGPRAGHAVYETAAQRLGRYVDPQQQQNERVSAARLRSSTAPVQGPSSSRQAGVLPSSLGSHSFPNPQRSRRR